MRESSPVMYVFAGNNGSGKSTIRNLLVDRLGVNVNIDADALARALDPVSPEKRKVSAGKEAIRLARECILHRRDFSVETTLAGGSALSLIRNAQTNGFEVTMFYVGLGDYRLNIERVVERAKNGGHYIPAEDIVRRHQTSIHNLLSNLHLIDHLIVIDNSQTQGKIVLSASNGFTSFQSEHLPQWVQPVADRLRSG